MTSERSGNPLDPVRKANEEDYFRKQNAEAAARLRARAQMQHAGIGDEALALQLKDAGFDSDTLRALYLIPLIDVAWADGKVQLEERDQILEVLKKRGVEESSQAYQLVTRWISQGTNDEQFKKGRALVEPLLEDLRKSGRDAGSWIVEAATRVATATGGLFGLGSKISSEESAILQGIAKKLR